MIAYDNVIIFNIITFEMAIVKDNFTKLDINMLYPTLLTNETTKIRDMLPMDERVKFNRHIGQIQLFYLSYINFRKCKHVFDDTDIEENIDITCSMMKSTLRDMCNLYSDILKKYSQTIMLEQLKQRLPIEYDITIDDNFSDILIIKPSLNLEQQKKFYTIVMNELKLQLDTIA